MSLNIRAWDAFNLDGGGVGWKLRAARLQIYNDGDSQFGANGWKLVKAAWWFEHSQLTDDPPTFHDEWHYIFNYTVPTAAPLSPGTGFLPLDDLTYPKALVGTWTSQSQPYFVNVTFYRSTNSGASFFVQETGAGSDASPSVASSYVYNAGDQGYVELNYVSLDGGIYGPSSFSAVRTL